MKCSKLEPVRLWLTSTKRQSCNAAQFEYLSFRDATKGLRLLSLSLRELPSRTRLRVYKRAYTVLRTFVTKAAVGWIPFCGESRSRVVTTEDLKGNVTRYFNGLLKNLGAQAYSSVLVRLQHFCSRL